MKTAAAGCGQRTNQDGGTANYRQNAWGDLAFPASRAHLLHTFSPRLQDVHCARRKTVTELGLIVTGTTPTRLTSVKVRSEA